MLPDNYIFWSVKDASFVFPVLLFDYRDIQGWDPQGNATMGIRNFLYLPGLRLATACSSSGQFNHRRNRQASTSTRWPLLPSKSEAETIQTFSATDGL